jgi:hypothetical protein
MTQQERGAGFAEVAHSLLTSSRLNPGLASWSFKSALGCRIFFRLP